MDIEPDCFGRRAGNLGLKGPAVLFRINKDQIACQARSDPSSTNLTLALLEAWPLVGKAAELDGSAKDHHLAALVGKQRLVDQAVNCEPVRLPISGIEIGQGKGDALVLPGPAGGAIMWDRATGNHGQAMRARAAA